MTVRILQGDVRDMLATLPDESVHCVVTSPPYWGLRDYGVEGQIGMEPTMGEHIDTMVEVFREVRRVLRKDGTVWLNYGDCYAAAPRGNRYPGGGNLTNSNIGSPVEDARWHAARNRPVPEGWSKSGLKPKDLCMIPNRLAIALQDDGWWVRSEIIWAKPNSMPESVTDRPATAHEKIWLLSKAARYWYDAEAVRTGWTSGRDDMRANGLRTGTAYTNQDGIQPNSQKSDKQPGHGRRHAGFNDRWKEKHGNAKKGTETVLSLQEDTFQISLLPEERRIDRECVSAVLGGQGNGMESDTRRPEEIVAGQPIDGGAGKDGAILCVSKGTGGNQTETCEPSSTGEDDYLDPDSGRMGPDQGRPPNAVCLLPEDRSATDPGSCNSDQQGRASPESERGAGVPPMQRPEGEQNSGANLRNVWTIPTKGFSGAHYATFPPDLIVPCIKAGTSEKGCCAECGAPWVREVETEQQILSHSGGRKTTGSVSSGQSSDGPRTRRIDKTIGWSPSCACDAATIPCTVLDPFIGSGTTAMVADRLGRDCIGIDLNPANVEMSLGRIKDDAGLFAEVSA